jgi:hypothetical protein
MGFKGRSTEEFVLGVFRFIVLAVLGLSLLSTLGALGLAAFQYLQSPEAVEPARKADEKATNVADFLQQLNAAPKAETRKYGEDESTLVAADAKPKAEPMKYRDEAGKIIACARELTSKAGLDGPIYNEEGEENFRKSLQHMADEEGKDRAQAYVNDALKVACTLLGHEQVIAYRKANPHEDIFGRIMGFHLTSWDGMKDQTHKLEREEEARVKDAQEHEDLRIAQARAAAMAMLMVAGIAFGVFMVAALYLVIAAVESNLRNINRNIEAFRVGQARPRISEPSRY